MKPLIGITTYYVEDREMQEKRYRGRNGQDMLMSTMDYSTSIKNSGGIPVAIPVIDDDDYIEQMVQRLDGILFSGGPDVYPYKYGQPVKKGLGLVVTKRDDFELKLLKKALEYDKAIFGICRGFELINIYFGGTVYQDLFNEKVTDQEHVGVMLPKHDVCHEVKIKKNSILHEALGVEELGVNSLHHQAVNRLGEGLTEIATSKDGIIEGFVHNTYSCLFGVQWHPEMMYERNEIQQKIFNMFIKKVNETIAK